MSRRLVSVAAAAITAVYTAGYVHTQAADSELGSSGAIAAEAPAATPTDVVAVATPSPTPLIITDQAVEMYADQHHMSWDAARAQMKAAGGVEQTATPTQVVVAPPTATEAPIVRQTAPRPTPTSVPVERPTAAPIARSAPVAPTATPSKSQSVASAFKDGTYTGLGTSRRGSIQVSLAVQGGRIAGVTITRATTEYPTRDIAALPTEVVSRQSAQVDTVSGATYSSLAFRAAVQQALQSAHA